MDCDLTHTSAASLEIAVKTKLAPWGLACERKGPREVVITQTARAARTSGMGVGGCYDKRSRVCTVGGAVPVEGVLGQRIQRAGWNLEVAAREYEARRAAQQKAADDDTAAIMQDKAIVRAFDSLTPDEREHLLRVSVRLGMRG